MAVNPLKIFLFLLGGSAAAGATAFVSGALDPYIYGTDPNAAAVVNAPPPAATDPAAPKGERLPGAGEETPPSTMAAAAPPEDATPPPAGGTMAAEPPADAAATPPADGATQLPSTMAATPPADDAAAQPPAGGETPPAAGPQPPTFDVVRVEADGSVVIAGKAMADALVELLDGATVLGSTKATPEGDFAIVLDEPLKPGDYQITLRATPEGGAAVASLETAVLSIPETPGGQVLAMVEQPGEASQLLTVPEPEKKPDEAKTEDAAPPPAETKPAEAAAAPAGETKPAEAAAAPGETTPPADATKPAEVAAAPAETTPPAEQPAKPVEGKVAVEAVEIEGSKIFVAGVGDVGRSVRVYANEIVLGEARISEGGRFLVEAERDLPVGNYIIRADLLDSDGATVIARATVPFEREEGESIAAVAPGVEQGEKPAEVAAAEQPTPPAEPAKPAEAAGAETTTPPADAGADGQMPPADAAAQPPPAVSEPEQPPVAVETPPPAETNPPATAENTPPPAAAAPAEANPPATASQEPPADAAAQPTEPAGGTDVAAAQPPETTAPKLEKVQGAVIIRRGDTLWRISRRVYGRGVRYSTIYLANQAQISDPDRIWPGQIFSVPDKSKEGEPADMSAMGDQMTTAPAPTTSQ